MFTGIIEEIGIVKGYKVTNQSIQIKIECKKIMEDIHIGDSISVNGVCLTVSNLSTQSFVADVMPETIRRSGLSSLKLGSMVNLERALKANGRLGGHFVTGHIDGIGMIRQRNHEGNAIVYSIEAADEILKYIVQKGSVAVDGISLTVSGLYENSFQVSVIPHTAAATILVNKKAGDRVNLECDMLGKYIEKFIINHKKSKFSLEFLKENGF